MENNNLTAIYHLIAILTIIVVFTASIHILGYIMACKYENFKRKKIKR